MGDREDRRKRGRAEGRSEERETRDQETGEIEHMRTQAGGGCRKVKKSLPRVRKQQDGLVRSPNRRGWFLVRVDAVCLNDVR